MYKIRQKATASLVRLMIRWWVDRAIGTFSRALDSTSAVRQPSLHMSAAAASRDITLVSHQSSVIPQHKSPSISHTLPSYSPLIQANW